MKFCIKLVLLMLSSLFPFSVLAIDVQVTDVPVRTVLEGLARTGNINLLVDDTVQGNLTMNLRDVTLEEALDAIAASQGLYYDESGPVRIMTGKHRENTAQTLHAWQLHHADPEQVKKAVQAALPEKEVRCHEDTNTLVVHGTLQERAAIQRLVKKLDVPTRQVDLTVDVVSVEDSLLKQTGVEWNWSTLSGGPEHSFFSYAGTIHALEEEGKAQILASPHLVASNGREAKILIGDKVPVQTEHFTNGETSVSTRYVDAGIKLRYTPMIHPDNSVTAEIFTEVSTPVYVPEIKAYRIATRQAQTVVHVRDNEPLYIGGLIRHEEVEALRKVPLLGSIPLLGKLFQYHHRSEKDSEVILTLRARVLPARLDV